MHYRGEIDAIDWEGKGTRIFANPQWVAAHPESWRAVERGLPREEGHLWVATSGSSATRDGETRWVALSHRAFLASAESVNRHLQSEAKDVWIHALPLFHVGGLAILARAHRSEASVVPGIEGKWDPAEFLRRARRHGATLSALVPTQVHDLVELGEPCPPSLRAVIVGGAGLNRGLRGKALELGWPLLPSYGMTETCSQIATAELEMALETEAPMQPLGHVKIGFKGEGRLCLSGSSLLTCLAEFRDGRLECWDPKDGGWLDTEDLASLTERGLEIQGRISDSLKVFGEKVYLGALEEKIDNWLRGRPARLDYSIAALEHERKGHRLVLCLAENARAAWRPEWLEALNRSLLPYERLEEVAFVPGIPRTALGKCRRSLLQEMLVAKGKEEIR